ncbi:hypothetical protein IFM89_000864 [Coptis chinensis]|uniref:PSP proline-rich domain-containing protein n=1 Tax=Coptis chinensis TaxID=261450 RepID=A0A835IJG8_9MAGN|nr:hypothetical protein IFM89_000864 [Coptis chinensis]
MMIAEATNPNGVSNGDLKKNNNNKKPKEIDRRRRRRKQKKNKSKEENGNIIPKTESLDDDSDDAKENADPQQFVENVEIEYVAEKADLEGSSYEEFAKVFEKFTFTVTSALEDEEKKDDEAENAAKKKKNDSDSDEEEDGQDKEKKKEGGVSNKKKKLQRRMKIAELKQVSSRPDVVEGKRGIEKQPFQLPDFIAATGIEKIRQAYIEKEDSKKLKQKQRERMQPKMGKMDIDYQVLHDAFFKFQTKPKLTTHGDLYYEGKEFEVKLREMKPGMLSRELKEALGMPEGAPPPWLINMQVVSPHTPTGVETPDVIDLRKQQRKEPEKPLYQVLEEKEEKIQPGTLLGTTHTYVVGSGAQDKAAATKRVDLLRGQKADKVDVTLRPEELEGVELENVLAAKYEEAREEEKLRSQREDFSDMVAENEKKRKRKQEKDGKSKKKDFKF